MIDVEVIEGLGYTIPNIKWKIHVNNLLKFSCKLACSFELNKKKTLSCTLLLFILNVKIGCICEHYNAFVGIMIH